MASSWPPDQVLVARLPADANRRALVDLGRLRAHDTDAYDPTSGLRDDEHAVAVVDDHTDRDRQTIGKRRALTDQLETLGRQRHVGGGTREAPAGLGVRLDRAPRLPSSTRPGASASTRRVKKLHTTFG